MQRREDRGEARPLPLAGTDARPRKLWRTPHIIVSEVQDTELGLVGIYDAGPTGNSAS